LQEFLLPENRLKQILFICTGNTCRSQMAEGLVNALWGDRWRAYSAGTQPGALNRRAVQAMAEIGIDISSQHSKNVSEFLKRSFDLVMTVCSGAHDECPYLPGAPKQIHLPIPDPAPFTDLPDEQAMPHFRQTRDLLRDGLARELGV